MTELSLVNRRRVADLVLVLVVMAGSSAMAHQFLAANHARTMFGWELAPAVRVACGAGFTHPQIETVALQEFLSRAREDASCADVEGSGLEPIPVAQGERYSIYAAGFALWAGGLSWRTLDVYAGLLFGLTMGLAFGIFRLVVGPLLALLGVVALVWSDQVFALLSFRDFGKAPAFFALWLVLGWLLHRSLGRSSARLLAPASLAGLLVGLGIGFRIDLLVFVPVFVTLLLFAAPGFDRRALQAKGVAVVAFVGAFLAVGLPVLIPLSAGSNSSHHLVLGQMRVFSRNLGLEPPLYDIGDHYDDSFAYGLIAAHAGLVQHNSEPFQFGSSEYDRIGSHLARDMAGRFPADALV